MTINFFDDDSWETLNPLTFTRPVADLRIGILTIAEKWAKYFNAEFGFITKSYLSQKFTAHQHADTFINGSICPGQALLDAVDQLLDGEVLLKGDLVIAYKATSIIQHDFNPRKDLKHIAFDRDLLKISYPEHIFSNNVAEINKDFNLLTKGRNSAKLSNTNTFLGDNIFVEEGATAECSVFNSLQGPIYLGKNSQVFELSAIRGSFALCEHSSIKMGTKIYPGSTVGPYSRVGGELNNAVIWGYSSKGHEGYLGNAVLGQWCNLGADTNNSNLKNNYANVKLWDYTTERFRDTGLQFCGLIMADHAKCAIDTMFNTGTVVGVAANIFGAGFPRNFIPDFSWGGAAKIEEYSLKKMTETAEKVFNRRDMPFDKLEKEIMEHVFEQTKRFRKFN
ncbi:UDP-N-acetylglucosamine diphosphorylase/glucosamine-1-phosphate N-acetyltransferase [Pedobacter sp. UYP30]|uniref:putative sugar nucleotidyl transferase n=1 Tax=Pedobacter sp. UYP30 TaxID=1756400 RepID=UPI0033907875